MILSQIHLMCQKQSLFLHLIQVVKLLISFSRSTIRRTVLKIKSMGINWAGGNGGIAWKKNIKFFGEMLGLKIIFMDGGSGAQNPISEEMIKEVRDSIDIPLIVGGGISSGEKAIANCNAGADIIVVGNAIEKDEDLIIEISNAVHSC